MPLLPGVQSVGLLRSVVVKPRRFNAFCALLDGPGVLPHGMALPTCFHSHVIPPDDEEEAPTASEGATNESEGEQPGASGASATRTSPANDDSHGDSHASTSAPTATEAPQTAPILVDFGS
jgi:hypothetical protein